MAGFDESDATAIEKLQEAIDAFRPNPATATSARANLQYFQELAAPLVGKAVEGVYAGQIYFHRAFKNNRVARTLPTNFTSHESGLRFEQTGKVSYLGILNGIDVVRRSQRKPSVLGLSLNSLSADEVIAEELEHVGEAQLHHPMAVEAYDLDEEIWLPLRAVQYVRLARRREQNQRRGA